MFEDFIDAMSHTVGQRLTEARNKQGLSIEDVAHKTRIRPNTLRDMESDDYSNFPNLTYAKSFLNMYSTHLEVDVSDFIREFGPANAGTLDVMSFLDPVNGSSNQAPLSVASSTFSDRRPAYSPVSGQSRGGPPIFFIVILLLVIGGAYSVYLFAKNASGDDASQAANDDDANSSAPAAETPQDADLPTTLPPSPFPEEIGPAAPEDTDTPVLPAIPIAKTNSSDPPVIVRPAIIEDDDDEADAEDSAPRALPFRPEKPE